MLTSVTATTTRKNAGTYSTTASGTDGNYNLTFVNGSMVIAKADLTQVTASKTYDGLSTVTYEQMTTIEGVNGERFTASAGTATISDKNVATANKTLTNLSSLTLTGVNGGNKDNYNLDNALPAAGSNNEVTISKAALTYTANSASRNTGATPSGLSGTVSGFVNNESQSTATSGELTWTTPATSASSTGRYAINGSGLNANNYSFSQATGNATALTLTPAPAPAPAPAPVLVPVVSAPPLPSNTSSASSTSLAENTQPFSGSFGINTLFPRVTETVGNFMRSATQSTAPSATLAPTAPAVSDERRNEIFTGRGSASGGSAGGNSTNRFPSSAPGARPGNESREGDSQAQEELITPALN